PRAPRRQGAVVRTGRERVLLFPRDRILPAEVLGRFEHAAGNRMVLAAGSDPGPGESVVQFDPTAAHAPAHLVGVELDPAHALHTTGDDDVGDPGLHPHRGIDDRLQAGSAASVDLQTGYLHGKSGIERGDPTDRGCFAVGVALPEQDVIDLLRRNPRAV